jgi:hypothetical protein
MSGRRPIPLSALLAVVGTEAMTPRRVADPDVGLDCVVLHLTGDPVPPPGALVLCADSSAVPACAAVALREQDLAAGLADLPVDTAVLTVPAGVRWADLYDHVRECFDGFLVDDPEHDLFAVADALATAVGSAVAIEDVERRVLAFSTIPGQPIDEVRRQGILGRAVPAHVEREAWYRRLWAADGVVEYPAGPESSARVAIAVRAGEEPVGSVWVIGERHDLHQDAAEELQRAAGAIADRIVRYRRSTARGREARAQLVRQLLVSGGLTRGRFAYELAGPSIVVAIRNHGAGADRELQDMRLADMLGLHANRLDNAALAAAMDGVVYAVLPAMPARRLEQLFGGLLSRAVEGATVAVSRVLTSSAALGEARAEVDRLLDLIEVPDPAETAFLHADRMRNQLLIAELAEAVRGVQALHHGRAAEILAFDREHGSQYAATLRAWFATGADVNAGAALLHVHPNTFRYRLSRAASIFELGLDDADERLLLHLQLRLADRSP